MCGRLYHWANIFVPDTENVCRRRVRRPNLPKKASGRLPGMFLANIQGCYRTKSADVPEQPEPTAKSNPTDEGGMGSDRAGTPNDCTECTPNEWRSWNRVTFLGMFRQNGLTLSSGGICRANLFQRWRLNSIRVDFQSIYCSIVGGREMTILVANVRRVFLFVWLVFLS